MKRGSFLKQLAALAIVPTVGVASTLIDNKPINELEDLLDILRKSGRRCNFWYECSWSEGKEYRPNTDSGFWEHIILKEDKILVFDEVLDIKPWYNHKDKHKLFIRVYNMLKESQKYTK